MSGRSPSPLGEGGGEGLEARLRRRAIGLGLCREDATGRDLHGALEALLESEVRVPAPTREECRRWYEAHPEAFAAGELVFASHILFAVTPRTPVDALRRKAEEVLQELRAHPERFAGRARELSNCTSGAVGGSLGQLTRGECVPEFEAAVFGTQALGVLPALVRSRYGFHIVVVERRVPGRRAPFEAIEREIAARLSRAGLERALCEYAKALG